MDSAQVPVRILIYVLFLFFLFFLFFNMLLFVTVWSTSVESGRPFGLRDFPSRWMDQLWDCVLVRLECFKSMVRHRLCSFTLMLLKERGRKMCNGEWRLGGGGGSEVGGREREGCIRNVGERSVKSVCVCVLCCYLSVSPSLLPSLPPPHSPTLPPLPFLHAGHWLWNKCVWLCVCVTAPLAASKVWL